MYKASSQTQRYARNLHTLVLSYKGEGSFPLIINV